MSRKCHTPSPMSIQTQKNCLVVFGIGKVNQHTPAQFVTTPGHNITFRIREMIVAF